MLGFRFLALSGLSSSSSSSSSCVASKLAFLDCARRKGGQLRGSLSRNVERGESSYEREVLTSGSNGGIASLRSSFSQSYSANQGCALNASNPPMCRQPSRFRMSRCRSCKASAMSHQFEGLYMTAQDKTHPLQQIQPLGTNNLLGVVGEFDVVLEDRLGQARVSFASVRSLAEQELVSDDAEGPPVDRGEVASFCEHFGSCKREGWVSRKRAG
jgi:hypothetical protein